MPSYFTAKDFVFMNRSLLLLTSLLSLALFSNAQSKRNTLDIDLAHPSIQSIPLTDADPFIAFSLTWAGAENAFQVSFSEDGERWTETQTLSIDPHGENSPEKRVSQLHFVDKDMKYLLLQARDIASSPEVVRAHFFSPGETDDSPVSETESDVVHFRFCPCPQPTFEARLDWCPDGSCPEISSPTFTPETHLIIHHSATSNTSANWAATVRSIWDFHVNTNGWSDIGYNWLVDPNGVLYEGRGDGIQGAHFCGTNGNTMGVCMLGNFTSASPSAEALATLTTLLAWKSCDEDIDPLGTSLHNSSNSILMNISGHRDGCSTACPGNQFYPTLPQVRNGVAAYIESNCSPLAAPLNLEGQVLSTTEIQLDWEDVTDGESGFEIERSPLINTLWMLAATVDAGVTTFIDTELNEDTRYYYRVRAVNETDTSDYSNEVMLNTLATATQDILSDKEVQFYPNPTTNVLTLSLKQAYSGRLLVSVLNVNGQELQSLQFDKTEEQQQFEFSMEGRPAGMYLLRIVLDDKSGIFKIFKH